jgi:hypothetical protein
MGWRRKETNKEFVIARPWDLWDGRQAPLSLPGMASQLLQAILKYCKHARLVVILCSASVTIFQKCDGREWSERKRDARWCYEDQDNFGLFATGEAAGKSPQAKKRWEKERQPETIAGRALIMEAQMKRCGKEAWNENLGGDGVEEMGLGHYSRALATGLGWRQCILLSYWGVGNELALARNYMGSVWYCSFKGLMWMLKIKGWEFVVMRHPRLWFWRPRLACH